MTVAVEPIAPFSENEFASICSGMAAGHLRQVREGRMAATRTRDGRKGAYNPPPPVEILRLEHLYCACAWLQRAAFYRALELV